MEYIDYSLIILFFVALFVLILVIAKPRPADRPSQVVQTSAPVQMNGLAYGLLATLLVVFLVLTVLVERDHTRVGSTS